MTKYLGIKNESICLISDRPFINSEYKIIELPKELEVLSNKELVLNYKIKDGKIVSIVGEKNIKNLKVALINNWKMQCGISTYAEFLYNDLIPHLNDYKLFIEKNSNPTGPLNKLENIIIPEDRIVSCWERGKPLKKLILEVHKYNPDIVLIQHEFGIFPDAKYWLSLMSQLNKYRVIVIMHSTFHHQDKTVFEASCQEIIVHLSGAKELLEKEKQISAKIHVVPHGCPNKIDKEKLWNSYRSKHTILSVGFGFRYKLWEQTIEATALLKNKYSDIFFTALFSESPYNKIEHQLYFNDLQKLISELGVEDHVGIIRGFQSENVVSTFLKMNSVLAFPYTNDPQHDMFGASGSARFCMSHNIPTISSNINHFSDLPTIKVNDVKSMAETIDKLFSDITLVNDQLKKQEIYLNENSWKKTAEKFINILENKE
jgi:glycosyltransferase involved in cell wall biosynthesis